ncbi:MAG: tetratricopeptide repeat protein [Terriglobales bacterium]
MRKLGVAIIALAMLGVLAMPRQAAAEDKGIIALQQSVSLLMSQLADLQKSFNQQIGMIQGLVTQNTDTVNKLASSLTTIQHALSGDALVASQNHDDVSKQFQQLTDALAAMKVQMQAMDHTLQQVHQMQQTIPPSAVATPGANPTGAPGGTTSDASSSANGMPNTATTSTQPAAASPMQQYQKALSDFQSGAPEAQAELARFIRSYPNDPEVPDATYFLGNEFMQNGQYNEAIDQFNTLIEMYPDNSKTPLAELNKGISLEKMGSRAKAISEFRALSKNHPGTEAARQADVELHRLEHRKGK